MTARTLDAPNLIRRVRRLRDLSQRDLARLLSISNGQVARFETGSRTISLAALERIVALAGLRLCVVDETGTDVVPMRHDAQRNNGGRRFAAHLDTYPPEEWPRAWCYGWRWDRLVPRAEFHHRERRDDERSALGVPLDHVSVADCDEARRRHRLAKVERIRQARERAEPIRLAAIAAEAALALPECTCPIACEEQGPCLPWCPCQCEVAAGGLSQYWKPAG